MSSVEWSEWDMSGSKLTFVTPNKRSVLPVFGSELSSTSIC
jgi:hypothetical protein